MTICSLELYNHKSNHIICFLKKKRKKKETNTYAHILTSTTPTI